MNKTVKLFTHTDLDGVGCAVITKYVYPDADVTYCNYSDINEKVTEYLNGDVRHDYIFITDISVNGAVSDRINEDNADWTLLDHHKTAVWLNVYDWAVVYTTDGFTKSSGTSMLDNYLGNPLPQFAEKVRSYDTWDWTLTGDTAAKDLNDLLYVIGRNKFVERFVRNPDVNLTADERYLLDIERVRIDAYKRAKLAAVTVHEIAGRRVGIVFADRYQSELGNYIVTERNDIDLVALIDPARGVSYRSKGDVDVAEFARAYAGGGHKNAAGSEISDEQRAAIVNIIFGGVSNE